MGSPGGRTRLFLMSPGMAAALMEHDRKLPPLRTRSGDAAAGRAAGLAGSGNFPRHRTICDFRAFHHEELPELFAQVVKPAREMELVKLGTVAIDGTKVKANASRHRAMSYERMKQADSEIQAAGERAGA